MMLMLSEMRRELAELKEGRNGKVSAKDEKLGRQLRDRLEAERREIEHALNETIEDTLGRAAVPNALAWAGVVIGSFVINLLLLVIVSGG